MTDVVTGETPAEPVPPIQPVPDAVAELEVAPAEAAASAEAPAPATEPVVPEIEPAVGSLRRAILDHLVDTGGEPQSVSQIIAALPVGTSRNTAESAIKRNFDAGLIERTAPGTYVLAKPKPAPPPESAPVRSNEQWLAWIDEWKAGGEWKGPGNPPNQPGHLVPPDVIAKHNERIRKRLERQRDREAALARQAAADRELRDKLIGACHDNFVPGPALDDVSPIRAALELVPLDSILQSIRMKTDRRIYPPNEPATSWREERLLRKVAEDFCRFTIVPSMVKAWSEAGKAPGKPAGASGASPAVQVPAAPEEDHNGQIRP